MKGVFYQENLPIIKCWLSIIKLDCFTAEIGSETMLMNTKEVIGNKMNIDIVE